MNYRHTISDPANGRYDILDGDETQYGEDRNDRQEELLNWIGHMDTQIKRTQAMLKDMKRNRQRMIDQLK